MVIYLTAQNVDNFKFASLLQGEPYWRACWLLWLFCVANGHSVWYCNGCKTNKCTRVAAYKHRF